MRDDLFYSVNTSSGASAVQPGGAATPVDADLTISGSGDASGANVVIGATNFQSGLDKLSFASPQGTIYAQTLDASGNPTGNCSGTCYSSSTGVLKLAGTATMAEYQAALRLVKFETSGTATQGDRTVTITLGANGLALSTTGHFYEFITKENGVTLTNTQKQWQNAKVLAESKRYFGLHGYLATITTAAENTFVSGKLTGQGWMGSSDFDFSGLANGAACTAASQCAGGICISGFCKTPTTTEMQNQGHSNTWRWVTGPEGLAASGAGLNFWSGLSGGSRTNLCTANGDAGGTSQCYANWSSGEPNNSNPEDFGHFLYPGGAWNDYHYNNTSMPTFSGYVVEYGGMSNDPPQVLSGSKVVRVLPPTCFDAIKNATETDTDCGGSCLACGENTCTSAEVAGDACACATAAECTSGVCTSSRCAVSNCFDGIKNGSETDLDCGGTCAANCGTTQHCIVNADCASNSCTSGICRTENCEDSRLNNSESDIDCGGPNCGACGLAKACKDPSNVAHNEYCLSGFCDPSTFLCSGPPTLTTVSTLTGALEDTPFTISYATLAAAADESDPDGGAISFRVEAVSSGTLTKNGSAVNPGTTLLSSGQSLVWTPVAEASGSALNAFTIKAWDGSLASASAVQVKVSVGAVADPPVLTVVTNPYAVSLNGTNAYLTTNPNPSTDSSYSGTSCTPASFPLDPSSVLNAVSEYTLSFWIRPGRFSENQSLVGQDNAFELALQGTTLQVWNAAVGALSFDMASDLAIGVWTHVGLTGDATVGTGSTGEVKLYVNGALKATQSHAAKPHYGCSTKPLTAGAYVGDANNPTYLLSELDELSIWNKVSTAAEVSALQTQKLAGTESGLLAYWPLDAGSGTTAASTVSATNNFQFAGSPTWVVSSLGGGTPYTENGSAVALRPWMTISDIDSATLASGTASLTSGFQAGDVLAFTNDGTTMGNITAAYDTNTGIITLTSSGATATLAQWVNALRAVAFSTPSDTPGTARTVTWRVNDGGNMSATQTSVVVITPVNDAPTATNLSASESYTEDFALNLTNIVVTDVDSTTVTATLTLSNGAAGSLSTASAGAVTSTYNSGTGVWTAAGGIADVNTLLASVNFNPVTNFNASFTISTSVSDGVAAATGSKSVSGTAVNDAPTATNLSAGESYTEDFSLNLTNIVVTDPDSTVTATLTLSNLAAGSLSTATAGAVTSTYNSGTGVWAASGAVADVNTLLAGVTFNPAANFSAAFTIATSVSDGIAAAVTGSKTVSGTGINDAPTATNLSSAESYAEDTALDLTDIVVTDVDSANVTALLTLSLPAAGSLNTATAGAVTSTYNAATGVWTASGPVVSVNALLATVTFNPAANSNGSFTIATSVSDGLAAAVTGSKAVTGTAVNDAPVAVAEALTVAEGGTATTLTGGATSVLANDTDAESSPLTAAVVATTTNGTLTLNSNGTFSYTHNGSETMSDSFTYRANDGAANSNTVTVAIAVTPTNDAPALAVAAPVASTRSIALNGTNHYFASTHSGSGVQASSVLNNRTAFTLSFWINPGRLSGIQSMVAQNDLAEVYLWDKSLEMWTPKGTCSAYLGSTFPTNTWSHLAITADTVTGSCKIYSNGVLKSSQTITTGAFGTSNDTTTVGAYALDATNAQPFQGKFSEISIWSVAKDSAAITALAAAKLSGTEANLLAYWPLDAGSGTTAANLVAGANAGTQFTLYNSPTWDTAGPSLPTVFTENGAAVTLAGTITITDSDSAALASGTVSFTSGFVGGDTLGFTANATTMGNIAGVYNAGTGLLTLTSSGATATLAQWQTALGAVTFSTPSDTPGTSRSIGWTVNDGGANSNTVTTTLAVASVNDAPTLTTASTLAGGTEDTAYSIDSGLLFGICNEADVDGPTMQFRIESVSNGTLTRNSSAVVPGTTLFSAGDSLLWTPTANLAGNGINAFTIVAWDGSLSSSPALQIKVDLAAANDAPSMTLPASFLITEDTTAYLTFGTTPFADPDATTLTVNLTVPDGTLTSSSGAGVTVTGTATNRTFSGAPAALNSFFNTANYIQYTTAPNADTTRVLTVTVSDGTLTTTGTVNINHVALNDTPTASAPASFTVTEDVAGNLTYTGTPFADVDSSSWTITLGVPAGAITGASGTGITIGGSATARTFTGTLANLNTYFVGANISYLTQLDDNTARTLTTTISDGAASSSASSTINITAVNDPPTVAALPSFTVTEDTNGSLTFPGTTFTDVDSNLTVTLSTADGTFPNTTSGAGVTVTGSGSSVQFVGAPANLNNYFAQPGWIQYRAAADNTTARTLTVSVTDGVATVSATTTITITAVNDAPVAVAEAFTVAEGGTATTLTGGANSVLTNDTDAESSALTAAVVASTTNGTLTLNGNGTFSYTHNGSETTSDSFTYRANDGAANSNIVTVAITVTPTNDAPVAVAEAFTVAEGGTATTLTGGANSVLTNDTDADANPLTAAIVSAPTKGALTLNSSGTFSYTHDGSETTSDSFSYRANDGVANSNTVTVAITITAVNDAPTLTSVAGLTGASENVAFTVTYAMLAAAANEFDIEGSALSFRIEAVSTGSLMKGGAAVAPGSTLIGAGESASWTPAAGAFGNLNAFTVRAWDGAAASSAPVQVTVFVISCRDGLRNGVETGIDCGGGVCGDCGAGAGCSGPDDCVSAVCTGQVCVAATCSDRVKNGTETGVDCGGAACGSCGTGSGCGAASDCTSGVCDPTARVCVAAACSDHVKNGTETAIDCGGPSCAPCGSGSACSVASDCASGICRGDHTCEVPTCNDGVRNDRETGVDCGGGTCIGCGVGHGCSADSDCASLSCGDDNLCLAPTCSDGIRNGVESGVDCGGTSNCARCETNGVCAVASDCASGVCAGAAGAMRCQAPTCGDHVANGVESGVDCGAASTCGLCGDGAGCGAGGDCTSGVCRAGLCQVPSCGDGLRNGTESGVDCGGASTCARCDTGAACSATSDCASGVCNAATHQCGAPSCGDGILNGSETGIDCGGTCASDCADGTGCAVGADCTSGVCDAATHACAGATCGDGVQNAHETDVDCGGVDCDACEDGADCALASDCASAVCEDATCLAPSCNDDTKNGDETDSDCGGACEPCEDGGACGTSADCVSDVCTSEMCQAPSCDDDVRNGAEADRDCGGACEPCDDGSACGGAGDCASGVCADGACAVPACDDGVRNGDESDADCGGACEACADGDGCASGADCASGVCGDDEHCASPACGDGVRNGAETGVDCGGGGACDRCSDGGGCESGVDCASGVCASGACQAAACDDGVQNGAETGADCGGDCAGCADGATCAASADCASGICTDGSCQAPACDDGVANGGESDVDCGGPCGACADGAGCEDSGDCASGVCGKGQCRAATCADGAKNGDETDTDCGGSCATCGDGGSCTSAGDCASGVCTDGACQEASCEDGVTNGDESDTDCGGTCGVCVDGDHCTWAADCKNRVCADGMCQASTCADGVANGSESAIDCGGTCADCAHGAGCDDAVDCASGVCTLGACQAPTCTDGAKNADESDVDCGGACGDCGTGATCAASGDCASGVCVSGACQIPTCTDSIKNGDESGQDCGGACAGCPDGGTCGTDGDCASGVCGHGICQIPLCTDGVANGAETGRDCGGSCRGCADGGACGVGSDCASGVCESGVCQPSACDDKLHNGDETGVDCGGACAAACGDGVGCADAADCASGVCAAGACQAPDCADHVENGAETDVDCGGGCEPCADAAACVAGGDCASGVCSAGICSAAVCGDGVVNGTEACDDGTLAGLVPAAAVGGDGCSATCEVEAGWRCEASSAGESSVCTTTCGDGALGAPAEACDDANAVGGDGCGPTCGVESGWACSQIAGEASTCSDACGDGAIEAATEACDDGNAVADDGCSERCTLESGWACTGAPSACTATDTDDDGVLDHQDNCPAIANAAQDDRDGDGDGDACDDDRDGDGRANTDDNCPDAVNPAQADLDGDGAGDACDDDRDGDSVDDEVELAIGSDPDKTDSDGDGLDDGVEVEGGTDPTSEDTDSDGFADGVETAAGTDPRDARSVPSSFVVSGAGGCAGGGDGGAGAGVLALVVGLALVRLGRRMRRRQRC